MLEMFAVSPKTQAYLHTQEHGYAKAYLAPHPPMVSWHAASTVYRAHTHSSVFRSPRQQTPLVITTYPYHRDVLPARMAMDLDNHHCSLCAFYSVQEAAIAGGGARPHIRIL